MAQGVQIQVIRGRDLRDPRWTPPWTDPLGFAAMSAQKRAAILACPLLTDEDQPVQLIGTIGGRGSVAVGRLDLIPGRLNVAGQEAPILWGSEWFVPPEHRGTLVGVSLLLRSQQLGYNLGAHGPSQMALPVYQKLKWSDVPLTRWILIRRSRSVVERYLGRGLHSRAVASVIDAGLWAQRRAVRALVGGATRGLTCRAVGSCPPELDAPIARVIDSGKITSHRSVAWLNWVLAHSFDTDPRTRRVLYLVNSAGGRAVGYVLAKVRFFPVATHRGFRDLLLGSVQDWMAFDPQAADERRLILLGVDQVSRLGVDAVEVCVQSEAAGRTLRRLGCLRAGTMHLMFKAAAKSPLARPEFQRPGAWDARPGDGDNLLF